MESLTRPVADPGFDLGEGGVEFVNGRRGGGGKISLKVLTVEVKAIC